MYVDFEISHIIWWHNGGFEGVLAIFFMPELVALCICWRVTHAAYRDTPEPGNATHKAEKAIWKSNVVRVDAILRKIRENEGNCYLSLRKAYYLYLW